MLRALIIIAAILALSACVSEPKDPAFIGARSFNSEEAAKTRVSLGLTYLKNGNFSQAKFNLDKALEFAPRSGEAHYAMAFYYQQVDEAALAEESYEKALGFSRNAPDVLNSYGAFLCKQGQYEKAKVYFLRAVNDRNYVSTAETYENLAICSQSQGKNEEAIEYFTSALNHQPTRRQSLYLLSRLYVEQQQWEEAKRTLFKYERNAKVSAESLYMQFQIAQGLNDTKTAVGYGEILKSMFPDHPNTQRYLEQMGKFKPSATITRKIRTQVSESDAANIDSQSLEAALSSTEQAASVPETEVVDQTLDIVDAELSDSPMANSEEMRQAAVDSSLAQNGIEAAEDVSAEVDTVEGAGDVSEIPQLASEGDSDSNAQSSAESSESVEVMTMVEELDNLNVSEGESELTVRSENLVDTATAVERETDAEASDAEFHVVQPQENLYRISLKYNVKMSTLLEWNNLKDASSIRIGTKLRVGDPNTND